MTPLSEPALPLVASRPLLIGEIFRLPIGEGAEAAPGWETVHGRRGSLLWPGAALLQERGGPAALHRMGTTAVFGRVLDDEALSLPDPSLWERGEGLRAPNGELAGSIWRSAAGAVVLPFDPNEAIRALWSERYTDAGSHGFRDRALSSYYRLRPLLPRKAQIGARRVFAKVRRRPEFPQWPVETSLHDFYDFLLYTLADLCAEPLPYVAPWPRGRKWALVLTHDVETQAGLDALELLREVELDRGYRSSWNFVPGRYEVPDELVATLRATGFEIGVHGLYHDGRDLESLETLSSRLPAMREAAERWGAVGFRSPSTHRRWELMPRLGFDYDSSYPDTDPYEPQPGGCCSWLPFFNEGLVELPITLPQDHTLFVILRQTGPDTWLDKTQAIRARGGMALLDTHPDYLADPHMRESYGELLDAFADDDTAWRALPADVARWWRRRASSWIEPTPDGWRVRGPGGDEATLEMVAPEISPPDATLHLRSGDGRRRHF